MISSLKEEERQIVNAWNSFWSSSLMSGANSRRQAKLQQGWSKNSCYQWKRKIFKLILLSVASNTATIRQPATPR